MRRSPLFLTDLLIFWVFWLKSSFGWLIGTVDWANVKIRFKGKRRLCRMYSVNPRTLLVTHLNPFFLCTQSGPVHRTCEFHRMHYITSDLELPNRWNPFNTFILRATFFGLAALRIVLYPGGGKGSTLCVKTWLTTESCVSLIGVS